MKSLTKQQEINLIRRQIVGAETRIRQIMLEQDSLDHEAQELEMLIHSYKVDLWDLEFNLFEQEGC